MSRHVSPQKDVDNRLSSDYHLVVRDDPKSPAAEAMRSLRTNLQYVGLDRPLKSVMITSAGPSEGKTSIAGNLAASLAQSGTKTIAVGVDLRKPSIQKVFDGSNAVGLTNVLLGQLSLRDALQETGIENLLLLPSGPIPPNPAELLGSKAMQRVIDEIEAECDIAIFDSPPVVAVTDAMLLARSVDGVILVVAMKQTPREMVRQAKEQLERVKATLLGVVLNRLDLGKGTSYYYYYYAASSEESAAASDARRAPITKARPGGMLARLFGRS